MAFDALRRGNPLVGFLVAFFRRLIASPEAQDKGIVTAQTCTRKAPAMSALGQERIFAPQKAMSALLPEADVCGANHHVSFGPKADVQQ